MQCGVVWCSVLQQCVAACCGTQDADASSLCLLQFIAVCCSLLQFVAVCCSLLQFVAVCCSVLQCVAMCCNVLQCVAVCCSLCCSVLQWYLCHGVLLR